MTIHATPTTLDSIKHSLVALRMPRALEVLDATLRQYRTGRDRRHRCPRSAAHRRAHRPREPPHQDGADPGPAHHRQDAAGFDFAFQPSLDRNRILALAELTFIDRAEVVHLLGPPGTGKSHLATALAVEAVKAGKSVYFSTLADIVTSLATAEREGSSDSACAISAAHLSWSSTRSATCRSFPVAATCSSNSSTPATRRAP